ncbi:MAG: hypothetical protein R3253_03815 [Longimicrobiales bacterium]|nr:hypothetical protein [Longimicrobiales bacterium]
MKRLTVDGIRSVLPPLDELRPLVEHLVATSEADPARAWSGSGELGTAGNRLVDPEALEAAASSLALEEHRHRQDVYRLLAEVVQALAAGDREPAAQALLQIAELEAGRDDAHRAAAYADAAYRVAREGTDPTLVSLALRRRARHRRAEGRYQASLQDYQSAGSVAKAAGDPRGAAEAYIGAGNVLEEQARWGAAADCYRDALALLEAVKGPVAERWHALLNLHVVLRSTGALDTCLAPLEEAQAVVDALEDPSAVPFLENARGQYRMALGEFQEAEAHLRRGVEAASGSRAEITIRLNLAEALLAQDRRLDAAEEARRAERMAIVSSVHGKLPEVYRLLGRIAAREGTADAFVLFERALEIATDRGLPTIERAQTLQAYAEAEARVGDRDAAEELMAEADRLYRSLGIHQRRDAWADRFDGGSDGGEGRPPAEGPGAHAGSPEVHAGSPEARGENPEVRPEDPEASDEDPERREERPSTTDSEGPDDE